MDAVYLSSHRLREKARRLRDIIGQYKYLVRDQDSTVSVSGGEQPAFSIIFCFKRENQFEGIEDSIDIIDDKLLKDLNLMMPSAVAYCIRSGVQVSIRKYI